MNNVELVDATWISFLVCEPYRYGPNCTKDCGRCKHGRSCSMDNGACPDGCEEGWTAEHCDTRKYNNARQFLLRKLIVKLIQATLETNCFCVSQQFPLSAFVLCFEKRLSGIKFKRCVLKKK